MSKRIRFAYITLKGGEPAVLSTVETAPGQYETLLASPDFEQELVQLRTTSRDQAVGDFNHLRKTYDVQPLTGKYLKLAEDLEAAAAYGMEEAANTEDSGTCNFDAAVLNLKGWSRKKVEQAAKAVGLGCSAWSLYGAGHYVFSLRCRYQGNARTRAAEAMCEALRLFGYSAGMYYQMD